MFGRTCQVRGALCKFIYEMSKGLAELWFKKRGELGEDLTMDHKCTDKMDIQTIWLNFWGRGKQVTHKKLLKHSSPDSCHSETPSLAIPEAISHGIKA